MDEGTNGAEFNPVHKSRLRFSETDGRPITRHQWRRENCQFFLARIHKGGCERAGTGGDNGQSASLTQNSLSPPLLHACSPGQRLLFGHAENADQSRENETKRGKLRRPLAQSLPLPIKTKLKLTASVLQRRFPRNWEEGEGAKRRRE